MNKYEVVNVEKQPYLYVERTGSTESADISIAMDKAFCEVADFTHEQGLNDIGNALSVYYNYQPEILVFRAGVLISETDMDKTNSVVKADFIPPGNALMTVHKGSFGSINDTYDGMLKYIKEHGITMRAPTWEVYLNSTNDTSENDLETAIYMSIADIA